MPKASLNISALCAEFCTNVVCPSFALESVMFWLRHCCWCLECSSCQRGEKKNPCEDWSNNMVSKRSKAGRHCKRGKSLCCGCCRATEDWKVKALWGSVSKVATLLLCWCHSGPVWKTQLEWTTFSLFHLLSTQLITELRGKIDALRFGLPQLKAQLQLTQPQIFSKQAIHKEMKR